MTPNITITPKQQALAESVRVPLLNAQTYKATALVGGGIGAAIGFAVGGRMIRYGVLGVVLGWGGSYAYRVMTARAALKEALANGAAT